MRLGAIDPDGDLSAGRTELLEEATVRADPQVVLRDLHLGARESTSHGGKVTRGYGLMALSLRHTGSRSPAWCPGRAGASQWQSCSL